MISLLQEAALLDLQLQIASPRTQQVRLQASSILLGICLMRVAVKVLVIEAGPFDQGEDVVLVPGEWEFSRYVTTLQSVPQTALDNQSYIVPFGSAVGGGSVINLLVWLRSAKAEYDSWEKQLGDPGWTWDTLLPYFKKSENFTPPSTEFAHEGNISWIDSVHGRDGPVHVSYPNFFWEGSGKLIKPICTQRW